MTVYVVSYCDEDGCDIVAVYSNRNAADAHVLDNRWLNCKEYEVHSVFEATVRAESAEPAQVTEPVIEFDAAGYPNVILPRGYDPMRVVAIPARKS